MARRRKDGHHGLRRVSWYEFGILIAPSQNQPTSQVKRTSTSLARGSTKTKNHRDLSATSSALVSRSNASTPTNICSASSTRSSVKPISLATTGPATFNSSNPTISMTQNPASSLSPRVTAGTTPHSVRYTSHDAGANSHNTTALSGPSSARPALSLDTRAMSSSPLQCSRTISFSDLRPQTPTQMSQMVPSQKFKTMADLDKQGEARLASAHQKREKVKKLVKGLLGKKESGA
jgi:hypothetical protein